jgi:hypothetical protein
MLLKKGIRLDIQSLTTSISVEGACMVIELKLLGRCEADSIESSVFGKSHGKLGWRVQVGDLEDPRYRVACKILGKGKTLGCFDKWRYVKGKTFYDGSTVYLNINSVKKRLHTVEASIFLDLILPHAKKEIDAHRHRDRLHLFQKAVFEAQQRRLLDKKSTEDARSVFAALRYRTDESEPRHFGREVVRVRKQYPKSWMAIKTSLGRPVLVGPKGNNIIVLDLDGIQECGPRKMYRGCLLNGSEQVNVIEMLKNEQNLQEICKNIPSNEGGCYLRLTDEGIPVQTQAQIDCDRLEGGKYYRINGNPETLHYQNSERGRPQIVLNEFSLDQVESEEAYYYVVLKKSMPNWQRTY